MDIRPVSSSPFRYPVDMPFYVLPCFQFIPGAFAGLGFLAMYVAGKLHTFSRTGKAQAWRLLAPLTPLVSALVIALSRTCDYHHHWQDVLCGSLLGFFCAYISYHHYYPKLSSPLSDKPYVDIANHDSTSSVGIKAV